MRTVGLEHTGPKGELDGTHNDGQLLGASLLGRGEAGMRS